MKTTNANLGQSKLKIACCYRITLTKRFYSKFHAINLKKIIYFDKKKTLFKQKKNPQKTPQNKTHPLAKIVKLYYYKFYQNRDYFLFDEV